MGGPSGGKRWLWGAAALYAAALAAQLAAHGWNPSTFLHVGEGSNPSERAGLPAGLVVYAGTTGYDGLHYYQVARDPFFLDPGEAEAFKTRRFFTRYQRILYPALSWICAAGRDAFLPWTMLAVNVAAAAFAAAAFLRAGAPGAAAAFATAPALSIGLFYGLTEPVSLAFAAWGWILYRKGKILPSAGMLALSCLAREGSALFAAAFALDLLLRREARSAAVMAASVAPALLYGLWLKHRLGDPGGSPFLDPFTWPLAGAAAQADRLRAEALSGSRSWMGAASLTAVLVYAAAWCAACAAVPFRRRRDPGGPSRAMAIAMVLHAATLLCTYGEAWATVVNVGRLAGGLSLSAWALAAESPAERWTSPARICAFLSLPLHAAVFARLARDINAPHFLT